MEDDLADPDLEDALMDEYVRSYGHVPADNWILVVHGDNSSEFYTFKDPAEMWCCRQKEAISSMINSEVLLSGRREG